MARHERNANTARASRWVRVSRSRPCPVCEKPDYCCVSADGEVVRCTRVPSDKVSPGRNGVGSAWLHRLIEPVPVYIPRERKKRTKLELARIAEASWHGCESRRAELADLLGVSPESLRACGVGWLSNKWVIPEYDGQGRVVGVTYRTREGKKFGERGGSRGIVQPRTLGAPPLMVVEGMSDVAACLTMGVTAVGRPSNLGGAAMIVALLGRLQWKGSVVVVGERDRKTDAKALACGCGKCNVCWPGRYGAERVAEQMRGKGWSVQVKYPSAKDTRAWLSNHRGATRAEFLKSLKSR